MQRTCVGYACALVWRWIWLEMNRDSVWATWHDVGSSEWVFEIGGSMFAFGEDANEYESWSGWKRARACV